MPIKDAARKRMRADAKRTTRNTLITSELKTLAKTAASSLLEKNKEHAHSAIKLYCKRLDMAVTKGIIHKKTAARKKSRVSLQFAKAFAAAPAKK